MRGSSGRAKKGRVNWGKIDGQGPAERNRVAAEQRKELELDKRTYRTRLKATIPVPDVKSIRDTLELSQSAFADRFGLRLRTVQQWEQGRAIPDSPARLLLYAILEAPDLMFSVARRVERRRARRSRTQV